MKFLEYGARYNACNNSLDETNHSPACMGNCSQVLEDIDVDLHNETVRWKNNNMVVAGYPKSMADLPGVGGIAVDILETEMKLRALIELLGVDHEEHVKKYKEILLEHLTRIREIVEAEREAQGVVIPSPRIIGPDGKDILH